MPKRRMTELADQLEGKTSSKRASKHTSARPATKSAAFYLSADAIDGLEGAWTQLRALAGSERRTQVTKSAFVSYAITRLAGELSNAKKARETLAAILPD